MKLSDRNMLILWALQIILGGRGKPRKNYDRGNRFNFVDSFSCENVHGFIGANNSKPFNKLFYILTKEKRVILFLLELDFVWFFFFDKNKMILIHSNREITSFNTAKNVQDESANKLTTSKLIAYNSIMPTKIYDKIKVSGVSMASGSATLTPKSLIE